MSRVPDEKLAAPNPASTRAWRYSEGSPLPVCVKRPHHSNWTFVYCWPCQGRQLTLLNSALDALHWDRKQMI